MHRKIMAVLPQRPPASGEGCLFRSEELYPLSLSSCSAEASPLCNEWALNGILPARFGHFSSSVQGLLHKPNPFLGSMLPKPEPLPLEITGPLCCLCVELSDPLTSGVSLVFQVAEEWWVPALFCHRASGIPMENIPPWPLWHLLYPPASEASFCLLNSSISFWPEDLWTWRSLSLFSPIFTSGLYSSGINI